MCPVMSDVCVLTTLAGGVCAGGDGEAWLTEACEGLDRLCSSTRSGTGDGLGWTDTNTLPTASALAVVALEVSMVTEGGDTRSEAALRFGPWASEAAMLTGLSPGSTLPLAGWSLSMSPRMHSGW